MVGLKLDLMLGISQLWWTTCICVDTFGEAKTVGYDDDNILVQHKPHLLSGALEYIYAHELLDWIDDIYGHTRCPGMVQAKFRFCDDEIQVSLLEILTAIREHRRNPPR